MPHHPREALEGLDAYFLAHAVLLPDGRFDGLQDAKSVIRARYIIRANPTASSILKALAPREFECLIYRLYTEMGYKCVLTPRGADGGRDVIAVSRQPGKKERLLIECKRYGDPVGVEKVRCLLGVVTDEKANKGLLVSASQFTKGARDFASRNPVELMSDRKLIPLLNEHLGSSWPLEVDSLAAEP